MASSSYSSDKQANAKRNNIIIIVGIIVLLGISVFFGSMLAFKDKTPNVELTYPTVSGAQLPPFGTTNETVGAQDVAVGNDAPNVEAKDMLTGEDVIIGKGAGKPQAIAIMAHWCPHCDHEVTEMNELIKQGAIAEGVELVAVATANNPEQKNYPAQTWLKNREWPGKAILDGVKDNPTAGPVASVLGVQAFPSWVFTNAEGKIVARYPGVMEAEQLKEFTELAAKK